MEVKVFYVYCHELCSRCGYNAVYKQFDEWQVCCWSCCRVVVAKMITTNCQSDSVGFLFVWAVSQDNLSVGNVVAIAMWYFVIPDKLNCICTLGVCFIDTLFQSTYFETKFSAPMGTVLCEYYFSIGEICLWFWCQWYVWCCGLKDMCLVCGMCSGGAFWDRVVRWEGGILFNLNFRRGVFCVTLGTGMLV